MKKIKLLLAAAALILGSSGVIAQNWTAQAPADGDFYLFNVGTGTFLSCGEDWGTHAVVGNGALKFTLANNGSGAYTLYTTSNFSYGNPNAAQLQSSGYVDQSVTATTWTFNAVDGLDNTYTLLNAAGNYLYAPSDGTIKISLNATEPTTNYGYWKLIDYAHLFENATEVNPVDVTCLIGDANFESSKATSNLGWTMTANNQNLCGGNSPNKCAESWHSSNGFTLSQTITVPNGNYKLRAQAAVNGSGENLPVIYLNDATVAFNAMTEGENSLGKMSQQFTAGKYWTDYTSVVTVTNNTITLGARSPRTDIWNVWDNFQLLYLGVDLSALRDALQDQIDAVASLEGTTTTAAYNNAKDYADDIDVATLMTEEAIAAASTELTAHVNAATALTANYSRYKNIRTAVLAINGEINVSAANTAVEAATTNEAINAAVATLRATLTTYLADAGITDSQIDLSSALIDNASPGTAENTDYWTNSNAPGLQYNLYEFYNIASATSKQTIATDLPAGYYKLTVIGFTRTGYNGFIYAGENTQTLVGVDSDVVNNRNQGNNWIAEGNGVNEMTFGLKSATSNLEIGINSGNAGGDKWTCWRSFKLEYLGTDPASVRSVLAGEYIDAQTDAQATHDDPAYVNVTGSEKTTLEAAIAATPSTAAEYEAATEALNEAVAAFTAAKTNYDIFVTERALADAISTAIDVAAPTSAENALTQFRALKVAEYNYVATAYPYSATAKIGEFSTWTRTGTVNGNTKNDFEALTSQHWSGAERTYYEQPKTGWDNSAWTANYTKTTTLPAGNYVIKVAARAATGTGTVAKITCSDAGLDGPIFNFGDTGKGITTAGVASFDEGEFCNGGNGRGWVWNYLPFTLTEEKEVTMTVVAEATGTHQWFSVCDGELLSASDIATAVAYDEDGVNTIEDVDLANVTMTRTIKVGYNTVCLPFNLTSSQVQTAFGTGTLVYTFSENSDDPMDATINFNKVIEGTISANVPVLVKATTASAEQVFNGVEVVAPLSTPIATTGKNFDYVGVYGATTVPEGDYYIGTDKGSSKLYKSKGSTNIKPFRAYIHDTSGAGVKPLLFIDDIETSIEEINGDAMENGLIYNLAGQRIQKMQKGINIVNGKKILY